MQSLVTILVFAPLLVAGIGWLHFIVAGVGDSIDHWSFLPPLFIAGVGLGLGFSALFQIALSGVPHRVAHVERTFAEILGHEGVVAWDGLRLLDWYKNQATSGSAGRATHRG